MGDGQHAKTAGGEAVDLGNGLWLIDLGFQGRPGVVAAYLLAGGDGLALIETGPTSTLPALRRGIAAAGFRPDDLTQLLVTHIHLDHAGAAGPLVRDVPHLTVGVHPIGAPHLADPSRLLTSAARIYGDQIGPLWGEVAPIPADQIVALADGMPVTVAGRVLTPIFTPGHASHHVAFWDTATGDLFTGDVGGVRMPATDYVCPSTPPPDLDPAAWSASVERLRQLNAARLLLTHYGPFDDVERHLGTLIPNLDTFIAIAQRKLASDGGQPALTAALHQEMADQLGGAAPVTLDHLEWATPSYMAALGLTRLLTKGPVRQGR